MSWNWKLSLTNDSEINSTRDGISLVAREMIKADGSGKHRHVFADFELLTMTNLGSNQAVYGETFNL